MAGIDGKGVGEGGEFAQGAGQFAGIAAGQIGAAGSASEEGVAGEEGPVGFEPEADAAGGVAGGVEHRPARAGQIQDIAFRHGDQGGVGAGRSGIEAGQVVSRREAPGGVARVQIHGSGMNVGQRGERGDMIHVAVRQQIGNDDGLHFLEAGQQLGGVIARIQDNGFTRAGVGDQITIFFDKPGDP